jgi:ABC-type glutathione transport system ATPase component
MLLLEVNNLVCTVRNTSIRSFLPKKRPVLKGVNLVIERGASLALLGESGGGKTTLGKCLVGLQQPDSGTIMFDGVNIFPQVENRVSVGLEMQMLFQGGNSALDPALTVFDSLGEAISARGGTPVQLRDAAEQLIASVGVPADCLGRLPRELSGGQVQRVALARTLAVAPRLLILDEPASALDALTTAQIMEVLRTLQMKNGISILYISHDARTALSYCDRVAVLHDGMIIEEGTSREILRRPTHDVTARLLRDSRLTHS